MTMVMGPSGSGKSTLIAALSGLLRPDDGKVTVLGEDLWSRRAGKIDRFRLDHCGFIFQGFNLFPALTALRAGGDRASLAGAEAQGGARPGGRGADRGGAGAAHAPAALRAFRRREAARGDRPRARQAPRLVFADEPTSALDGESGQIIVRLLRRAATEHGAAVICVTHDPRLEAYADRLVRIEDGRILSDEPIVRAAHTAGTGARPDLSRSRILHRPGADRRGRRRSAGCQKAGQAKANAAARRPRLTRPSPTARPTSRAASSRSPPAPPASCATSTCRRASVTKGQVLARQEDDAPRLAVATAEASSAQAKAAIGLDRDPAQRRAARGRPAEAAGRRALRLHPVGRPGRGRGAQRRRDAEAERAAVGVAETQLSQARYTLDETIIRAPIDGKIVRRYAKPGVGASTLNVTPMFDLEPAGQRIVRAEVSEGRRAVRRGRRGGEAGRRRPTRPRAIRARCCASRRCSASASCSPTTRPADRRPGGRGGGQRRQRAVPDRPARAGEVPEAAAVELDASGRAAAQGRPLGSGA